MKCNSINQTGIRLKNLQNQTVFILFCCGDKFILYLLFRQYWNKAAEDTSWSKLSAGVSVRIEATVSIKQQQPTAME